MKYRPVIGIETHVQLNTITKLFCRCLNEYAPETPNKNICPFCTGQPGALPVLNKSAAEKAILFGLAIGANIPESTRWDRKNYFYPDSPTGYQISQYDNPIVEGGKIEFYIENRKTGGFEKGFVELERAHLEGDAAKLIHAGGKSMVDFNRCATPLIEIVTKPTIRSSEEAMAYINELQLIVRTIGISDGDMEKGQMRFDCNISMQNEQEYEAGKLPKYKVEVKNINSVRAAGRAIESEIIRQTELLEAGQIPVQETRGWRDDLNRSDSQRSKEDAHDYRYFPEPDLQILEISESDKDRIGKNMPELPKNKRERYLRMGLSIQTANIFTTQSQTGELFDQVLKFVSDNVELAKVVANLITGNLLAISVKQEVSVGSLVSVANLVQIGQLFLDNKINNQGVASIFQLLVAGDNRSIDQIVADEGLEQINDDSALEAVVKQVIEQNQPQVEQYRAGKVAVLGFLVGQCMKQSGGKGNPKKFGEMLTIML
jgi:aspartyl-tRNA(Asn)/glutamyl-tRNA(Gln) amidotransferase subunit B